VICCPSGRVAALAGDAAKIAAIVKAPTVMAPDYLKEDPSQSG